jgi:hypothetical protein
MKRKTWIQCSVIVVLLVLPFLVWGIRKYNKREIEMWGILPVKDASVQIISTPADTNGAFGLVACISPDGTKVAIAGNKIDKPVYFDPTPFATDSGARYAGDRGSVELQEQIKVFLKNIYWAGTDAVNPDFWQIDKHLKIRSIKAMAFSNTSPQRLAYISREFEGELPSDIGQHDPSDFRDHVRQMVKDTYKITSEYSEIKNKPPLFFYRLYVVPLEGGEPKAIGLVHPKRNECFSHVDFYHSSNLNNDMDRFSLCWTNDDSGFYYKDDAGISYVSLDGEGKRIYSLEKNRMFFSRLRAEKNNSVSFIERNNIDVTDPPPEGGADELITINRTGNVLFKRKIAEGNQWYHAIEGVPQAAIGRTKWAYALPEMKNKQIVQGKYIIFVASFQSPLEIQQYRVSFEHKMPFYCIMVGFNADENQLWFTKKFNLYEYDIKELHNYQSDAPFSELIRMDIE